MAKTYKYAGEHLTVTAPAALVSGEMFAIGSLFMVALHAAANGAEVVGATEGVWTLTCNADDVIAVGAPLYFDASEDELTLTAAGNIYAGIAVSAAGATVTSVDVKLGQTSNAVLGGSYTAVAGDATANTLDIVTGLTAIASAVVQIRRADIDVTSLADISWTGGTITVADNSTDYVITADDVITWIAFGR